MVRFQEYQDSIVARNNARIDLDVEKSKMQKIEQEKKARSNILIGIRNKIQNYPNILSELKIIYRKIEVDVKSHHHIVVLSHWKYFNHLEDHLIIIPESCYFQYCR